MSSQASSATSSPRALLAYPPKRYGVFTIRVYKALEALDEASISVYFATLYGSKTGVYAASSLLWKWLKFRRPVTRYGSTRRQVMGIVTCRCDWKHKMADRTRYASKMVMTFYASTWRDGSTPGVSSFATSSRTDRSAHCRVTTVRAP